MLVATEIKTNNPGRIIGGNLFFSCCHIGEGLTLMNSSFFCFHLSTTALTSEAGFKSQPLDPVVLNKKLSGIQFSSIARTFVENVNPTKS